MIRNWTALFVLIPSQNILKKKKSYLSKSTVLPQAEANES